MRLSKQLVYLLLALLLVVPASCNSQKKAVTVYPVVGQVSYAGQPAEGVNVFLYPLSAPTLPDIPSNPHGLTGSDGRFTISTFKDGDGAAEGDYLVVLLWPPKTRPGEEPPDADQLLGWYSPGHTPFKASIKAGDNALPPFELPKRTTKAEGVAGIPGRN